MISWESLENHTSLQVVVIRGLTYDNVTRCGRAADWALWHSSITAAWHPGELGLRHHLQTMAALYSPWWEVHIVWQEEDLLLYSALRLKYVQVNGWMCVSAHLYEGACCSSVAVWGIRGRWLLHSRGSFRQCDPAAQSPLSPPCGSGCHLGTQSALRYWTVASARGQQGDHLQRKKPMVSTDTPICFQIFFFSHFLGFHYHLIRHKSYIYHLHHQRGSVSALRTAGWSSAESRPSPWCGTYCWCPWAVLGQHSRRYTRRWRWRPLSALKSSGAECFGWWDWVVPLYPERQSSEPSET